MGWRVVEQRLFLPSPDFGYWLLLTNTYVCIWIYAYILIYAQKEKAIHEETLVFCFPMVGSSNAWGWALRMGRSQGRGQAAGLMLQCDHDSTCWILRGKGSRGDKLALLGMGGKEDRQEALVLSRNYTTAGAETELALRVLHAPTRRTQFPVTSWRDFHSLYMYIHPAWKMSVRQPSWDNNTRWTWPPGYRPSGSKMQIVKVNSTNTRWLKILHFQRSEAVCKFFMDRKKIQLYQIIYTPWIIQAVLINSWKQKTHKEHILQGSLLVDCNINLLTSNLTNVTLLTSI